MSAIEVDFVEFPACTDYDPLPGSAQLDQVELLIQENAKGKGWVAVYGAEAGIS